MNSILNHYVLENSSRSSLYLRPVFPFQLLAVELQLLVISSVYLLDKDGPKSLLNLSRTCKHFYSLVTDKVRIRLHVQSQIAWEAKQFENITSWNVKDLGLLSQRERWCNPFLDSLGRNIHALQREHSGWILPTAGWSEIARLGVYLLYRIEGSGKLDSEHLPLRHFQGTEKIALFYTIVLFSKTYMLSHNEESYNQLPIIRFVLTGLARSVLVEDGPKAASRLLNELQTEHSSGQQVSRRLNIAQPLLSAIIRGVVDIGDVYDGDIFEILLEEVEECGMIYEKAMRSKGHQYFRDLRLSQEAVQTLLNCLSRWKDHLEGTWG